MKHLFLLDENILYFAVKGVDEHDRPDLTSAELLRLIAQNCHKFVLDKGLSERYWRHIRGLQRIGQPVQEAIWLLIQLLKNSDKAIQVVEEAHPPPEGIDFPREDIHILTLALFSKALIVSGDPGLRDAINNQPELILKAVTPHEAVVLASDT